MQNRELNLKFQEGIQGLFDTVSRMEKCVKDKCRLEKEDVYVYMHTIDTLHKYGYTVIADPILRRLAEQFAATEAHIE